MIHFNKQASRVALVTGGSRRIGASIVQALHKANFNLVIHCYQSATDAHLLEETLNRQRKNSACVIQGDLRSPEFLTQLINSTINWGGRLDTIVNNASVFIRTEHDKFDPQIWQNLFEVNVQVPYQLSSLAYPFLKDNHGVIINITDIHAHTPLKGYGVYCQTKAALVMQTKALAKEFAPNVRVNAVAPGAIAWPEHQNALDDEMQQAIINKTPLNAHGHPDYIAETVLFLVNHPFITGQVLKVDGGRSI